MKTLSLIAFITAIAIVIAIPTNVAAEDICRSRGVLRDKLLNYDIEMRTKKIALREKRIALMQQDNTLEKEMVQTEEQILKANSQATKDVLQTIYDKTRDRRSSLDKEQDKVQKDYAKVVYERIVGRIKLRITSLESKYSCLLEKAGDAKNLDAKRKEFQKSIDAKLDELAALQKREDANQKASNKEQDSLRTSIRRTIRDWRDWLRDFAKDLPK